MITDQELAALFRAERNVHPSPLAADRGWNRLSIGLASNVAPLAVAAGPLKLGFWLVPKWIVFGFVCGLAFAGAVSATIAPAVSANRATRPTDHALLARAAIPALPVSVETELHGVAAATVGHRDSNEHTRAATAPSAASVASAATFDAELHLISLAKAEVDAGRPARARAWLTEHTERFPLGVFVVEREALLVLVLCQQNAGGPALAEKFAQEHPSSPLVTRLRKACAGTTSGAPSARASFESLPNDSAALRERTIESDTGDQ